MKKLIILGTLSLSLNAQELVLQNVVFDYPHKEYDFDTLRCEHMHVKEKTILKNKDGKPITILCDRVEFEPDGELVTQNDLQLKSKFISGNLHITGKKTNIDGAKGKSGAAGADGVDGFSGADGVNGRNARAGSGADEGKAGANGKAGGKGMPGRNGEQGGEGQKNVTIDVRTEAFDKNTLIEIVSLGGKGGIGGDGGLGGHGGNGGNGGSGGTGGSANGILGQSAANGGNGGNGAAGGIGGMGGNSGDGGKGGDGGDIYVFIITEDDQRPDYTVVPSKSPRLENYGGNGGSPGTAGGGGNGGNGGNGGLGGNGGKGELLNSDADDGKRGLDGAKGEKGLAGKNGIWGKDGERGEWAENITGFYIDRPLNDFKHNNKSQEIEFKAYRPENLVQLF